LLSSGCILLMIISEPEIESGCSDSLGVATVSFPNACAANGFCQSDLILRNERLLLLLLELDSLAYL